MTTVVDPAFTDGQPGNNCPVAEPKEFLLRVGQMESSSGVLEPEVVQTVPLEEADGPNSGTMDVTPQGSNF